MTTTQAKPVRHESKDTSRAAGRRVDFAKSSSAAEKPTPRAPQQNPANEAPVTQPVQSNPLPSAEEAANDPLVKAVLEVFDGKVKQVYPRK